MIGKKRGMKRTVLIVDDEYLIRWSLEKGLRGAGFETKQAASGEEALSMIEEIKPDVVLLDLSMPGKGGFYVLERAARSGSNPLFIVLTSAADNQTIAKAVKNGAVDYICKPFEINDVTLRIQIALESAGFQAQTIRPGMKDM